MTKAILTAIFLILTLGTASVLFGCTLTGYAHYQLGWDTERANSLGNTVSTLAFFVGWVLAMAGRR